MHTESRAGLVITIATHVSMLHRSRSLLLRWQSRVQGLGFKEFIRPAIDFRCGYEFVYGIELVSLSKAYPRERETSKKNIS